MVTSFIAARRVMLAVAAVTVVGTPAAAEAANVGVGAELRVQPLLRSMKALRDANVVKQRFDYSCGAAALATLLRYGFGDAVTEREIVAQLFSTESDEQQQVSIREGFSLLDLQRVAQAGGYQAEGFRITPEDLPRLSGPVIVFIQPRGYRHFAVLRGVHGDRVWLADPSLGNVRMPLYRFLESWRDGSGTGIIFAVEPAAGLLPGPTPLTLSASETPQPEILTARELLAVGSPFVALPELAR
jgi:uncharacterized protein